MLPARGMKLPKDTEEQLKRIKQKDKVTPNVASRIAFFVSIEAGYRFSGEKITMDGTLKLDKVTWLGPLETAIEQVLCMLYPDLGDKEVELAWAAHVRNGASLLARVL